MAEEDEGLDSDLSEETEGEGLEEENADAGGLEEEESGEEEERVESPEASASEPGGELFGDVVSDKAPSRSTTGGSGSGGQDVHLRDSVAGIYDMVKDLEVQLNHMVSINEAADRDLEATRRSLRDIEKERDELLLQMERMKRDAQSSGDLREELRHMTRENERLIEQMRSSETKTEAWERRRDEMKSEAGEAEMEVTDLQEEVECLEAQISQAAEYIDTLRGDIMSIRDARQQQTRKMDLIEQRLQVVTEERDALRQELNESRSALEEIKRSIMDTNMQSQLSYYDS